MSWKILAQTNCGQVAGIIGYHGEESGDLEFRIVGKDGRLALYIPVAKVPYHAREKAEAENFVSNAKQAIRNWFANPKYSKSYCSRAVKGRTDPHRTWREIRKYNKLEGDYDIRK